MTTQTKQRIEAGSYDVDPVHSHIGFAVVHNGVSTFRSGFNGYDAKLVGGEHPSLTGSVAVDSIDIDEPQLRGHLLSPDFFDVERHPRLEFHSTELDVAEDGSVRI
ncbi:MAG TPA: YceI family protein, partial [Solirubrobacterales bacterium]